MRQCAAYLEPSHTLGAVVDEYGAMIERLPWKNGRNSEQKYTPLPSVHHEYHMKSHCVEPEAISNNTVALYMEKDYKQWYINATGC
jgi:hypothetical protein